MTSKLSTEIIDRIKHRDAIVGIIGLGYVGLPLVKAITNAGLKVIGQDNDPAKIDKLNRGETYIAHLPGQDFKTLIDKKQFRATTDIKVLAEADAVLICVPTPITEHREPDLSFVEGSARAMATALRPGQLIILESTTYPGTTRDVMKPILEQTGLKSGTDFLIAYSPEREDPGNPSFETSTIPKVVGGDGPDALEAALALYNQFVPKTVPVSSLETAEAVKITENVFRAVNIALVNELKLVYGEMGIDVWEVIEAAKTKPFGYMAFYPGPGLGGHCIPVDPFYLSWKARAYDFPARFVELAGEVNDAMPRIVVERLGEQLSRRSKKSLNGARILMMGLAYKKNVDDLRESPAMVLYELLEARGAVVEYHDPFIPEIHETRDHPTLTGRKSVGLNAKSVASYDAALIVTDHDNVDYNLLVKNSILVVDTRNAVAKFVKGEHANVYKT